MAVKNLFSGARFVGQAEGERQKEKPTRVLFAFLLCSFCLAEGKAKGAKTAKENHVEALPTSPGRFRTP